MPVDVSVIIARVRGTVEVAHIRLFRAHIPGADHQFHFRPVFAECLTDKTDCFRALVEGERLPLSVIGAPDFLGGKVARQFQFFAELFPVIGACEIYARLEVPEHILCSRITFPVEFDAVFQIFRKHSLGVFVHVCRTQRAVGVRRQDIGMRIFAEQFPCAHLPLEFQRAERRHSRLRREGDPPLIPVVFQIAAVGMKHGRYRR